MKDMNRKQFLYTASMGIGALFFSGFTGFLAQPQPQKKETTYHQKKILIIGSGYGGAVAALRLCEQGHKVTMLEMGMDWGKAKEKFSSMLHPDKSAAWLRTKTIAPFFNLFSVPKFTGVLDRWDFPHVKIWMGRGVGGGSLVNGGMAVTPKQSYFKEIFPQLDTDAFYTKYFPLANQELGVNVAPEDFLKECEYYRFSRVGEMEAHKAGFKTVRVPNVYDFDYMQKEYKGEVPASALAGEVIYGNNHGKKSLDKTYLKKALATGNLEIWDLHQVDSILQIDDTHYRIKVSEINTQGEVIQPKEITCEQLFLAAGTMGTLEILLKSNVENGLPISEEVGKYWGNNGNFMTGRNFVQTFSGGTGTKQSTIPVAGIDHWDDEEHSFFTEIAPLPMGMNVATALYLMVNPLKKYGTVSYDKSKGIQLDWDDSHTQHMMDNAKYFIRKMNRANGGTRSHLLFHNGFGPDICYHPLGGVVLGKATNAFGRLNRHKNLYVVDGSLVPGTIGVNPFVTIVALAEYCMEHITKELS
ncbi:GMC oxidoreductase [Riemerella columbina]|uniref:GMC oxidoreductase n=1 Tax=Riemerella columbina TaxID=103810 RepID=UPI00037C8C4A|nr:GMC oxidoreductase [Riemerella columbina]